MPESKLGSESKGEVRFLLKHSSVYGIGNLLSKAVGFILLPLYTRYLSPTDYGILELIDVTSGMIGIVIGLGVAEAVSRFYYEPAAQKDRNRVVSTAYWVAAVLTGAGALIASLFAVPLAGLALDSSKSHPLLLVSFAALAVGVIVDLGQLNLRLQYKSVVFNTISIVSLVLGVTLNVIFIVVFHWGVMGILVSSLLTRIIVGLPLTIWTLSQTGLGIDWPLAKQMVRFGAPLVPSSLATTLVNYSDRYFIKAFASIADAGIWGLANKMGTSIHMLITSPFIMTFLPRRFEIVKRPDAQATFARVGEYFFLLITTVGLFVVLFVDEILHLMPTPGFYSAGALVPWIVLSMVLFGMKYHFEFGILYAKKTHHYAMINIATAVLHIVLNLILVRAHGVFGAALAAVGTVAFNTCAVYVAGQRLYPIPFDFGRQFRVLGIAMVLFFASQFIHFQSLGATLSFKGALFVAFPALLFLTRAVSPEDIVLIRGFIARRFGQARA
jgi:O-antigen/teichoic acid export membrane protein